MKYLVLTFTICLSLLTACGNDDNAEKERLVQPEPACCGFPPEYQFQWEVPGKESDLSPRAHNWDSELSEENSERSYFSGLQSERLNSQCISSENPEPIEGWVSEAETTSSEFSNFGIGEITTHELQLFEGVYQVAIYKTYFKEESGEVLSRDLKEVKEGNIKYLGTNQIRLDDFAMVYLWASGEDLLISEENLSSILEYKDNLMMDFRIEADPSSSLLDDDKFLQFKLASITNRVELPEGVEPLCAD